MLTRVIVVMFLMIQVDALKQAHVLKHAPDSHDSPLQSKARTLCEEHGGLAAFRQTKTKGFLVGTAQCVDSTLLVVAQ